MYGSHGGGNLFVSDFAGNIQEEIVYEQVTCQLYEFLRLFQDEKKKAKDYGSGIELYHAEVIFLECIARNESENASGLARCLGVSKGAVSYPQSFCRRD